jgi:hypothetical protein
MASRLMSSLLAALFLTETILSLQVSSNSPCTSLCLDPGQSATNTTASNTLGSDITCVDASYEGTPSGQRFMSCVNCLQTSTTSDDNGNDQGWFLCRCSCKATRTTLMSLDQIIYVLLWIRVCLGFNSHLILSLLNAPRLIHVNLSSELSRMATFSPPTRPSFLTVQRTTTPS